MSPQASWRTILPQHNTALVRGGFAALAAVTDASAIIVAGLIAAFGYHAAFYDVGGVADSYLRIGLAIAVLFVIPNVYRGEYTVASYASVRSQIGHSLVLWNIAFISALALGFFTKTTAIYSRGTMLLFYGGGWTAVVLMRAVLAQALRKGGTRWAVPAHRVFLVGFEEQVLAFAQLCDTAGIGVQVVAAVILRAGEATINEDLALAAASARMLRPDDVFVLVPWSRKEVIDACLDAFLQVPASIHLGSERVLDRFMDARISNIGPIASLQLVRRPLSTTEIVVKRLFDLVAATLAMLLLSPLFLAVALLIKLDSKGPILFFQRRYGFNQEPFRIVKFRSMVTLDDGAVVPQVSPGDVRVTRVGRFLRRWNLDELPQLLNVVAGQMSLVGPRPHALAHNQHYERRIALYARRHNVRPGITGWAQVNGYRGETRTEDRMRARVEHDLHYIDNWSLLLDLRILALTVLSRKAFRNAY